MRPVRMSRGCFVRQYFRGSNPGEEQRAIVTVLRDGEVVGDVVSAETTPDEIKHMMVGREISGDYYRADTTPEYADKVVLSVRDLTVPGEIENVSFDVHESEILGFCGLSDSGIHTVGKAVYGLLKPSRGRVRLNTRDLTVKSASQALQNSMAYVPKDRDN